MPQGHIRQRGKRSWEIKFDLGNDPITGERITRYVNFKGSKREAQAELTRLLNSKNEGSYVDPTKMTVGEYLDHWLAVYADRQLAAKTAARHHQIVKNNIKPRLGNISVRKLTKVHIEAFEADLQRDGYLKGEKKGSGLSAQTVLHIHRTLSQALQHAVDSEVLIKNPAEKVEPPRLPGREIKILTKPEIATLLKAAQQSNSTQIYVPVLLAVTTGLRRGEVFGLRRSDLDLAKGRLTVNQSLEYVKRGGERVPVFKPPKTKTSRRTITLPALTVEALKRHLAEQAVGRLKLGLGKGELVFTRADGEPISLDYITKAFNLLVERAGVTRITFHGLRHTHISHQLMDGIHVKLVSERAGHSNVSVTLTVYATFIPSLADQAADQIDGWLRDEISKSSGGNPVAIRTLFDEGEGLSD